MISVTAIYHFSKLDEAARAALGTELQKLATGDRLRGLLILSPEGINGTVAGTPELIEEFKAVLRKFFAGESLSFKDSQTDVMPFRRFKVDRRSEVVTTFREDSNLELNAGTYLSPAEWDEKSGQADVVILDTRNVYETELGVFRGAVDPHLKKFSEFAEYANRTEIPKDKTVLMYCTGGIRCEKALPIMKAAGFKNVFQLQGGILRYLAERPEGAFEGECFVFDHRVSVDKHLQPSKRYKLCPHCGNPAAENIECLQCGLEAVVCRHCLTQVDKRTCSKNCAYHVRKGSRRSRPSNQMNL